MKGTLLLLFTTIQLFAFCQEVIATQGETQVGANGSLEYTIGEVVINTISGGTNDLTQGFHQPMWEIVPIDNPYPEIEVTIYPNPMTEQLNIETLAYEGLTFSLYDDRGRLIAENVLESQLTTIQVDALAKGAYFLTLRNESQKLSIKTFKIIKSL